MRTNIESSKSRRCLEAVVKLFCQSGTTLQCGPKNNQYSQVLVVRYMYVYFTALPLYRVKRIYGTKGHVVSFKRRSLPDSAFYTNCSFLIAFIDLLILCCYFLHCYMI